VPNEPQTPATAAAGAAAAATPATPAVPAVHAGPTPLKELAAPASTAKPPQAPPVAASAVPDEFKAIIIRDGVYFAGEPLPAGTVIDMRGDAYIRGFRNPENDIAMPKKLYDQKIKLEVMQAELAVKVHAAEVAATKGT
jgi:hypothetical protein